MKGGCRRRLNLHRSSCVANAFCVPSCLVLDVTLPGLNGLDLQKRLVTDRTDMPIIFITGFGDVPITVQAMKAGAVEFLTKPFKDDELLSAIRQALERSKVALDQEAEIRGLHTGTPHLAAASGRLWR